MSTQPESPPVIATQISEYSKTAAALADLQHRYKDVVFDLTTRDGMVTAIKARAELRGYRVTLEKTRKELKAPALERARLIDDEAKRITAELVAMEDPIDEAIKAEEGRKDRERAEREQRERDRVTAQQKRVADIGATPAAYVGESAATIERALGVLRDLEIGPDFEEYAVPAAEAKGKAIAAMEQLLAGAKAMEAAKAEAERAAAAERAELERLRQEAAEWAREEASARAEREAADKAAREALEAEQRAARERIAAEEREAKAARDQADAEAKAARDAEAARQAEADRVARLAREAEEKVAREARELEQARQAKAAQLLREAQERVDAERRETERLQNELIDGDTMLRKFVDRFGKRREFASVVKAINAHLAAKEAAAAEVRG
jgi:colicin import membrane protein